MKHFVQMCGRVWRSVRRDVRQRGRNRRNDHDGNSFYLFPIRPAHRFLRAAVTGMDFPLEAEPNAFQKNHNKKALHPIV
jgi:hypothetical protein